MSEDYDDSTVEIEQKDLMAVLLALNNIVGLVLWLAIAIVLFGVFWMVWLSLRKWYYGTADDSSATEPWTLQELRELRDSGEITIEEYETLRQQIIGGFKDKV